MDIGSILLILALALLVSVYILQPFRTRRSTLLSREEIALSPLLAERERILDALVELDFDHELGKVPENIYALQRNRLLQMGADVLRQIDELQAGTGEKGDEQLEEKVAARRAAAAAADDPLEAMIAARRTRQKPAAKGTFCHSCGEKIKKGDRFCASCGADLA
jgi:hypothetical protein